MRRIIALTVCLFLILGSLVLIAQNLSRAEDEPVYDEPTEDRQTVAMWLSQFDLSPIMTKNGTQREQKDYTQKINSTLDFVKQNGISKDPTTNQKLKAAYNSKNPDVVDMVDKAEMLGFVVDFVVSQTPTRIIATSTLFKSHQKLGSDIYFEMLSAIKNAWYGDPYAISSQVLTGMMEVYKAYYGNFKQEEFVKSLKKTSPASIIRNGRTYTNPKNRYALEIIKTYNQKRRYKLDERKLEKTAHSVGAL